MNFLGQNNSGNNPSNPGNTGTQSGGGFLGAKPQGSIFGTPSGPQPSASLFGATPSNNNTTGSTGLFGNLNVGASANASNNNASTGGTSAPFSLPKPPEQGSSQQPAPPNLFGSASGTSTSAPLFGLKPAANTSAATSSSPSTGLFGGGNIFGKQPASTTPAATSSTTTATSTTASATKDATTPSTTPGNLFGSLGGTPKPAEAKSLGATSGFNLFGAPKADDKKDGSKGTTGGFNLFGAPKTDDKKDESKGTPFSLSSKEDEKGKPSSKSDTSNAISVAPPSMLRGKTIEEIVNRWSAELEAHVKEFNRFAGEVAVWDRALIENSKNIATLHSHVSAAEREQNEINQSLDQIEQQQKDLSNALDAYEKITQEILGGQGAALRALDTGPADTERDKNYMLATDLHTQLDDLSGSLSQLIDSVNALSLGESASSDDPLSQISQILSGHLESLQWIDGAVREVEGKVGDVESRIKDSGLSAALTSKSRGFSVSR